jgi:hypothetical protein
VLDGSVQNVSKWNGTGALPLHLCQVLWSGGPKTFRTSSEQSAKFQCWQSPLYPAQQARHHAASFLARLKGNANPHLKLQTYIKRFSHLRLKTRFNINLSNKEKWCVNKCELMSLSQ